MFTGFITIEWTSGRPGVLRVWRDHAEALAHYLDLAFSKDLEEFCARFTLERTAPDTVWEWCKWTWEEFETLSPFEASSYVTDDSVVAGRLASILRGL
jgi:hypothetical protein